MEQAPVRIVEVRPTKVWIESDFAGSRHVVVQHEGCPEFTLASFHYNYLYTDNNSTKQMAEALAAIAGAVEPIEHRFRQQSFEEREALIRRG